MKKLILLCSTAFVLPTAAFAQSTGSVDFEKDAIVVTGTRGQTVGGVQAPDSSKAKAVLTQDAISRATPGQSILDTINQVPGVSFQNNDAYGSSGGGLTIRGFDNTRVSLTFDGVPLNDSGNYSIYSNQQLDPELIEQVNVNMGTTDVDSPTASAVGGTINYRTRLPQKTLGGRVQASYGEFNFFRVFGSFDTGEFTDFGTRAFFAASKATNDNPFNNYGKVDKQQYNGRVYQPIGSKGDFISISGHYNQNRTNRFGSVTMRNDRAVPSGFPQSRDDREYEVPKCLTEEPTFGAADPVNICGTQFDRRYNPSNTGNMRIGSKFTLAEGLVLTVDPSYQYVKANGGGTTSTSSPAREYGYDINPALVGSTARSNCSTAAPNVNIVCVPGYFGGAPYFNGVDLNGDGDTRDLITLVTPSQTRTHRLGVIGGLRWTIDDNNTFRVGYTFDHANHRQTGQVGLLDRGGEPLDVFPVNNPLVGSNAIALQKRDRQSYAILHKLSGEYRGEFFNDKLTVNIGLASPWFTRKLDQNCFSSSAANSSGGFVECSGGSAAIDALIAQYNPYTYNTTTGAITGFAPPGERTLKYNKLLPNLGFIYDFTRNISLFGNYAQGISVPSTDNLYSSFFFPENTDKAKPKPETTSSFDLGARYRSSKIQAQVSYWNTRFKDREAVSFDEELNQSVFRNLGVVDKHGFDGSVAYAPIKQLTLYAFGSVNNSKIRDNIQVGALPVVAGVEKTCDDPTLTVAQRQKGCAMTAGQRESGAPKWMYGGTVRGLIGPVELGFTAKKTGPRYVFDTNEPIVTGTYGGTLTEIFAAQTPAYWLVNADVRFNMDFVGLKDTFFQLNAYNLFDKLYVGTYDGNLGQTLGSSSFGSAPFVQIGAPRTISGTINIGF